MYKCIYKVKNIVRKLLFKCTKLTSATIRRYNGIRIVDDQEVQFILKEKIQSGKPFMAARLGSVELRCMVEDEDYLRKGKCCFSAKTWKSLCNNAGFFPADADVFHNFAILMRKCGVEVDMLGVWCNPMEDYIAERYMKQARPIHLRALEPYYFTEPWSKALEGKKVLVVHPFSDSILAQYQKREEIWQGKNVLPDFELKVLKAIQTSAGEKEERFNDWFQALEYMQEQIKEIDFDIAILGCGAYGFPLAAYIKKMGKQAIHMGGATQILFGIKGKRWDNHPVISQFYNEAWKRPDEQEIPRGNNKVEGGCYW